MNKYQHIDQKAQVFEQIREFWPYVQATDRPTYERASPSQGLHYYSARSTGNITSNYVATYAEFRDQKKTLHYTVFCTVVGYSAVYRVQQLLQYIRSIVNTGLSDSGTLHTIAQRDTYSIHSYLHSGVCIIFENQVRSTQNNFIHMERNTNTCCRHKNH